MTLRDILCVFAPLRLCAEKTVLLLAFLLTTATACAQSGHILLVNRPPLYSAPSAAAPSTCQDWPAGARLGVVETRPADRATSGGAQTWLRVNKDQTEGWMPDVFLAPPPQPADSANAGAVGEEQVDRTHGIAPDYAPTDLVAVGPPHDKDVDYRLRREAAAALKAMVAAARADGVRLQVVSGYRPWTKQQELYERALERHGWGNRTVARPGHSEHQLGTAVDLTDGDEAHLLRESFGDTPAGRWLCERAWSYGFAVSYTRHNAPRTGYDPEPWHYRYWGITQSRTRHYEALGEKP